MKTVTKDFIHARGMNSDVQTIEMLMREAANVVEATELFVEGAYRIQFASGESTVINNDEMKWLRDYVQECTESDFYIKMLDGSTNTAVA
jgi:hypothetical protein